MFRTGRSPVPRKVRRKAVGRNYRRSKSLNEKHRVTCDSTHSNREKFSELKKSQQETPRDMWLNWLKSRKEKLFQIGRGCESSPQKLWLSGTLITRSCQQVKSRTNEHCLKLKITTTQLSYLVNFILFYSGNSLLINDNVWAQSFQTVSCEHQAFKAKYCVKMRTNRPLARYPIEITLPFQYMRTILTVHRAIE